MSENEKIGENGEKSANISLKEQRSPQNSINEPRYNVLPKNFGISFEGKFLYFKLFIELTKV